MKNTYLEKRKFTRSCEGQQVYSRSKLKLSVFVLALTAVLILGFENRSEAQSIIYGGAFDITSGVTFDDISPINVNSFPLDIEFSRDGLTMFVLDGSDKEIDYFSLTEPFVTTSGVSLDGSFVVSSFEFNANGFCFSNDGMKMFLVGSSGDDVSGFNLTNPYDLSTGVTEDGSAFPVSDQVEPPRDVVLSANGKKMFVLGATAVYQYSLVVPNRVFNGVSYDNVSFSVSSQDASCFSLSFNEEGSRMFILGGTGKDINQYNLLNPFDLSSGASFAGDPFGVSGQESFPRGVALSQSGNRMFVVGTTGDDVNQYSLDVDEGFSETGANDGTVAGSITLDLHGDVFTNPNSTLDYGTDYSISNLPAGLTSSLTVSSNAVSATLSFSGKATTHQRTDDISNLAIDFENSAFGGADASSVVGAVDQEIYYGISFDNNSAVLTYGSGYEINHSPDLDGDFAVSGQEGFSTSLTFSNDGDKLFVAGINSDAVFQYSLTTPFDITVGVTYDNVSLSVNSPQDIDFNNDGTKMFILRDGLTGSQVVYQYTLTTPFDLSSGVSQDDAYLYVLAQDSDPRSITFSNDGYTMLLTGLSQTLYQYTLSEPFDFSGEETLEVSTFDFSGQDTAPQDIDFNKTGTRLYMVGRNSDNINEYSLPVPFDISGGISHTGNTMSVGSQLGLPRGMAFNDGGTKVFAIGSGVNKVFQYSLNNESIFNESAVGDGSLDDTDKAVIRLVGDNFSSAGSVLSGSAYSVTNLPAGLSPVLNVAADGKSADFSISGSAVSHSDTDDLENLIFTFENSAFVSGNAATVINSNNTESGFGIDFEDDITAPSLTSLSPQDDAIDVSLDAIFTLNFDEPVAPGAGSILVKRVSDDVSISIHNVSSAVTFEGNSVSFTPFAGLATHHNTEFYIQVPSGAIEDQSGNTYEGFSNNTTWSVTTEDLQPYIVSLDPSDEDVDVSANSNFAINFDKPIAKGTGLISFYRENRDEFIFSVDVSSKYVSVTGNVAVVNPFDDLPEKENVYITMANTTFISPEGINSEAIIKGEWNFATADETAPLMSAISPVDNSTEISNEANLVITFDEDVQKGTGVVSVKRMSDDFLLQSFNISESFATISTNTLTVDLPSPLPYDTEVYVEFGTGVILDLAGNNFGGVAKPDWSFTIEEAPDTTPPTITDFSPNNGAVGVLNDTPIVLTFSEPVQLTGAGTINIKRVSNNASLHSIDPTGAEVVIDGNVVTITPDGGILSTEEEVQVYVNWSTTPFEDLAGNAFNDLFSSSDYRFTVDNDIDEVPPSPLTFSPEDEAINVSPSADLVITFDEEVVSTGQVRYARVKRKSNDEVLKSLALHDPAVSNFSGSTVTIALPSDMPEATELYIEIPASAIQDLEGNLYAGFADNESWDFTTADITPPTITNFSPANGAVSVSNDEAIVLTFSEPIQQTNHGNDFIRIKRVSDNSTFHEIEPEDATQVTIDGNVVTIQPTGGIIDVEEEVQIYIHWTSTPFEDLAGNDFNDLFSSSDYRFTVDNAPSYIEWTGTEWSNGTGPNSDDDVLISGMYTYFGQGPFECNNLTIASEEMLVVNEEGTLEVNGDIVNNGSIRITSGSSLITYEENSITGNDIEFRRITRYDDGKYSFVGSPVEQNSGTVGSELGSSVYWYDESVAYGANEGLNRWKDASNAELVPGKGYTQAFKEELVFFGKPNTGTITYSGTYTEDTDDANEGWHLVSNPYAAAIRVGAFLSFNDHLSGSVYIWDDNGSETQRGSNADYIVANGFVATNTTPAEGQTRYNGLLGSAQGFFVKLSNGFNTDVTFNEDMRVTDQNSDDNFFRKVDDELSYIRINLTDDRGLFKQAIVGWLDGVSDTELDRRFDARVFNKQADYALYTIKGNHQLAIQGVTTQREEVPLTLNVSEAKNYSIEIDAANYAGSALYLRDELTNEVVDLSFGPYSFYSEAGQIEDRFTLLTSSAVLAFENAKANIYAFDKMLHIETAGSQPAQYRIFNLSGVSVMNASVMGSTQIDLSHLTNGVYIVSDGIETKKIIIK